VEGHERDDTPVLITDAAVSQNDQLAERKRRYLLTMSMRVPFLIAAVLFHDPWWVAVIIVVLSVPLPWVAVLMANDRPPRRAEDVNRHKPDEPKQIEHTGHPVIEG
jgi:ABC-type transport system involved in cytochrome bd biosynthesis fused ATPase/permease subunit